ncbi:MAG: DEAD/DEAH box helicase [Dermatophilaceae bacterium]
MSDADPPTAPDRPLAAAVAGWSRTLTDVGGPNTLLWAGDHPGGHLDLTLAHPGGVSMLLAGRPTRLSDLVREPLALADALDTARALHTRARRIERERGLACTFIAIGTATWTSPRARSIVEAPVLLRPCRLRPHSPAEQDFDVDLRPSVDLNPVLVNYLRSVAGIEVDAVGMAELTRVTSGFDPYPVYAALGRLCADIPGFEVVPRLIVGTYPFTKAPMVADLSANAEWLGQVDLVAGLGGDAHAQARLRAALGDVVPDPDLSREVLVLDADAVQASVVDAVRSGAQLVVQAPPGTGATQTVANAVAAMARDGRRILVVSPLRSSVEDLVARLESVGLGDLVLAVDAAVTDRHTVAATLAGAVERAQSADPTAPPAAPDPIDLRDLVQQRQRLVDHVDAMHETRMPWGVSVHEAQVAIAALAARQPPPGSRIRLSGIAIHELTREHIDHLAEALKGAAQAGAWSDDPTGDPWYGADIDTEADVARARDVVTRLSGDGLAAPSTQLDGILAESSLPAARSADDWRSALRTMHGVRDTLEVFRPEVFDIPLDEHVVATGDRAFRQTQTMQLGAVTRWRVRRHARRLLRPGRPPQDLHGELASAREQRRAWHRLVGAGGRPEISPRLDEAQLVYDELDADLSWLGARLAPTDEGGDLVGTGLASLRARLGRLADRLDRLDILPQVTPVLRELRDNGMGEVLDDFARRSVAADQVAAELAHIWWTSVAQQIASTDPRYRDHDGPLLHAAAARLRELDTARRDGLAVQIRAEVDRRVQAQIAVHHRQAELLRVQGAAQRRLLPFADLFRETEDVLTALRPCLAMSPYAVAQLLPPGTSFDLVVVQDADRLATAEVVSALSRARQALVVGDPGGSAPAPFVVGASAGPWRAESGAPATTVLAEAAALIPVRTLDWRHGEADVRLAGALAGADGRGGMPSVLTGAPGPQEDPAVRLITVDGAAQATPDGDAAIEWTQAEVMRTVELVLEHAHTRPTVPLGVVALTPELAARIEHQVRATLRDLAVPGRLDAVLEFFDEAAAEPFFVAALDEPAAPRAVLVLSVGFGRTPHGRVLHRFPSLSTPGAYQALGRAVTLARRELVVVSTLRAADLDPGRLRGPGPLALRELLAWAETAGRQVPAGASGAEPGPVPGDAPQADPDDSDALLADLADRLRHEGLRVRPGFGVGRHTVDLAVGHRAVRGRYLVAVEGDGPAYAAIVGSRGRDRLRPAALEALGWRHLRVWSTDLYRDPAREVARIVAAVREQVRVERGERPDRPAQQSAPAPAPTSGPGAAIDGDPDGPTGDPPEQTTEGVQAPPTPPEPQRGRPTAGSGMPVEQTRDDTDAGWGERPDPDADDRWLQQQRPPHWE